MQYFSSDWHLGHANIIKYDNRPFKDVEEMNSVIINNHNSIVKPEDEFYFLGDFCMGDHSKAEGYLQRINGKKYFIRGNHDKKQTIDLYKQYGTYLGGMAEIQIDCLLFVVVSSNKVLFTVYSLEIPFCFAM